MRSVRAAVLQAAPVVFDSAATIEKVAALAARAAGLHAQIVLFPEAFVSGYPKGLDFGARVGVRRPEGREEFRRYWESAIDVPGPATESLADVAGKHGIYLVIGVIERDGGTLYCTVLFFAPDATLLGNLGIRRRLDDASQTHAHRHGAADLGIRRRLDDAGF